jgi:hypothetical protein
VDARPLTGNQLWTHPHPTQYDLAVATPSWGPDNILVVSSSYEGGTRGVLYEDGVLALTTPTPTALTVQSKVQLLTRVAWTPPVLAGTTLYVRDRKTLMALKVG